MLKTFFKTSKYLIPFVRVSWIIFQDYSIEINFIDGTGIGLDETESQSFMEDYTKFLIELQEYDRNNIRWIASKVFQEEYEATLIKALSPQETEKRMVNLMIDIWNKRCQQMVEDGKIKKEDLMSVKIDLNEAASLVAKNETSD